MVMRDRCVSCATSATVRLSMLNERRGEQADDAREHARLVVDQHRQRVALGVGLADRRGIGRRRIGGGSLVHGSVLQSRRRAPARKRAVIRRGRSVAPTQRWNRSKSMLPPDRTRPTSLAARGVACSCMRRRERRRAGAFGEIVRIGPIGADRRGDLVVGDQHDARGALADDRRALPRRERASPCRRRACRCCWWHDACRPRTTARRTAPPSTARRRSRSSARARRARRCSRKCPNPADRHIEHVEIGMLAEQLERVGRDAEHEIAMERRHDLKPARPASRIASSRAAWKSSPCSTSSAPSARIAAFFSTELPRGT